MKGLRELRHAANVAAGSAQPRSALSTSIFDVRGATGRRAMRRPRGVIRLQESRRTERAGVRKRLPQWQMDRERPWQAQELSSKHLCPQC